MIILFNGEPQRDATNLESILELGDFNLEKFELEKIDPKVDIALILYSSGTTGMPKGVLLTHANLRMPFVYMGSDGFESNLSDIYVQVTPCTHIIGTMMFGAVFGYGSTLIFLKKFEPEMLLKTIEKYKVNKVMFVPQIILFLIKTNLLEKYDISTLTKFYCGGAMLNKDTVDQFLNKMKYCKLQQVYGLTETTGATIMSPKDDNTGSIGKIMPNNRCKIVDILTGKAVGPNEIGEICIIGDSICNGYHNREDATRELIDDDGFVHTGDVGYYNENELIYVIDRIKDIIKHKGFQVSPAEIETVLMLHDSVEDVGAIGIPDQRSGEAPCAFVVLKEGHTVSPEDLISFTKNYLSSYKIPKQIIYIDEIPKNQICKNNRKKLLELWKTMNVSK
ncbi:PREDICTED: 4-coumarate--CoA ligase 1-like [Nicrophorus vespilloides]|uniref:4-coumarate--CoA ligase 1-like n=1 Tax=Nicrophorus vespilloides TaxID=110193 RepID=A0ABM1M1J2_NICVS|nr:PREDICTED: 4-coumarate--CoA ligase 1-like [Nicrophorus vespilloides]